MSNNNKKKRITANQNAAQNRELAENGPKVDRDELLVALRRSLAREGQMPKRINRIKARIADLETGGNGQIPNGPVE